MEQRDLERLERMKKEQEERMEANLAKKKRAEERIQSEWGSGDWQRRLSYGAAQLWNYVKKEL